MSYDLMVFNHLNVPAKLKQLQQYLNNHMENDMLPDKPASIFNGFLEDMQKVFPPIDNCPENMLDYACSYEIHEDFIYMGFAYSVAKQAHAITKRQAKFDNLGFWDVSQSFDRTYPITLPNDKWPMIAEAEWTKYGSIFVYNCQEIQKLLTQMKKTERSSLCITDRWGNYIQTGGCNDSFIVEKRIYSNSITYEHMRADLSEENSKADAFVQINGVNIKVSQSQIFSTNQVLRLFEEFTEEVKSDNLDVFWKKLDI